MRRDRFADMRLVHYAATPIGPLRLIDQGGDTFKPRGLWVSDDACVDNWAAWCLGENFGLQNLGCPHDVRLAADAHVLVLGSAPEIDEFTSQWATDGPMGWSPNDIRMWIDWSGLREHYAGLIITPYIWERRLSMAGPNAMWYYSWDCASGCIWDPAAVASISPRPHPPPPDPPLKPL